jgi:hypothetical protein
MTTKTPSGDGEECPRRIGAPVVLAFTLCLFLGTAHAADAELWALSVFAGPLNDDSFGDTLTGRAKWPGACLAGVGLARSIPWVRARLGFLREALDVGLEGQAVRHLQYQNHWELNGLFLLRWLPFPWDGFVDTSFAFGEGLSYATDVPDLEARGLEDTPRLLNYLLFELAFSPPGQPALSLIFRLHHRSGVFGLFGGKRDASNAVLMGVRFAF